MTTRIDDLIRTSFASLPPTSPMVWIDTVAELDPMIAEAAEHWRIERMNVLDRLILRLAVYEFLHWPETPAKVIINEALELASSFSGDDSVRFINGILDGIRRRSNANEHRRRIRSGRPAPRQSGRAARARRRSTLIASTPGHRRRDRPELTARRPARSLD